MQTRFHFGRSPLAAGAFCLTLAAVLTGCASKNPLMEEPAPMARKKTEPKAEPVKQEQAAAPAAEEKPAAESVPATTAAAAPQPQEASASETARTVIEATPENAPAIDKTAAPASVSAPAPANTPAQAAQTVAAPTPAPAAAETTAANTVPEAAAAGATAGGVQTVQQKRFLGFLRPYRPDVQQGNFVSREMVAQLKPGMTQDQVTFLLGTPLLNDIFHADRWDYAFRLQKGNGEITTSRVTVYFQDGLVTRYEGGGDLPTEADYLARIANKAKAAKK